MRKVVINSCYGEFILSNEAIEMLYKMKHPDKEIFPYKRKYNWKDSNIKYTKCPLEDADELFSRDFGNDFTVSTSDSSTSDFLIREGWDSRHDPDLIKVVETLGDKASGHYAKLEIVEIDDNEKYIIDEYDGFESLVTLSGIKNWDWK